MILIVSVLHLPATGRQESTAGNYLAKKDKVAVETNGNTKFFVDQFSK